MKLRMPRLACRLICVALVVTLAPARVYADGLDEARGHYERANAAYALGNYVKAAEEFEKTFDLKPDPALLYNAAQSHRLGGNKERALLLYQNYLRIYGDRVPNVEEVKRHIVEVKAAIASEEQTKTSPPVTPRAPEALPSDGPSQPPPVERTPGPVEKVTPAVAEVKTAPRPLAKRPWLWVTVIGGVVVVGTAIALGVVFGTKNPTPSMGGVNAN